MKNLLIGEAFPGGFLRVLCFIPTNPEGLIAVIMSTATWGLASLLKTVPLSREEPLEAARPYVSHCRDFQIMKDHTKTVPRK